MQFMHLGLLPYFLPLVAIPIVLHLLTLQRLKTVELSTFRFLFDSYVQQRRKMKLMEWLIAALRTLFLLLLVLCVARPIVKHWSSLFVGGTSGRDVVLLMDSSASMEAVTDGETSLQRAKRVAGEVVERLSTDDRVTVVRVGSSPTEICSRFSSDAEKIRSEIESLQVSPSRANLFAAFSQLFAGDARKLNNPLVYLFSDLQTSGWDEFEPAANTNKKSEDRSQKGAEDGEKQASGTSVVPDGTELIVVNVGTTRESSNRAVSGRIASQRAIVGLPIRLFPQVSNYSDTEPQTIELTVTIDDKQFSRQSVSLQPGETKELELTYAPPRAGTIRGRFEIVPDRFSTDDSFLFALDVAPRVKVLLVNGNPSKDPLQDAGLYLRTAIVATESDRSESENLTTGNVKLGATPTPATATDDAARREFQRSLQITDVTQAALNQQQLRDADVVVLVNCGAVNAAQCNLLTSYVAEGGGLMILPGDKVKADPYNKLLLAAPRTPDTELLAATLGAVVGDRDKPEAAVQLDAESCDFAHPVLAVFADPNQKYFAGVRFYRHFEIGLPLQRAGSSPLALFTNGKPAIVESRYEAGRVLLTAFPLHSAWTNLPLQREFVPLALRMISHVKRPAELFGPAVVPADTPAEFSVSAQWAPVTGNVTHAQQRVTPLTLERSNSRLKGAFDNTVQKGYYHVEIAGGGPQLPKRGSLDFAVNVADGESDFQQFSRPELREVLPGVDVTVVDATSEAQQLHGAAGSDREIWRPLIILMFVVIAVEFTLSTLGGQSNARSQAAGVGRRIHNLIRGDQQFVNDAGPNRNQSQPANAESARPDSSRQTADV